MNAPSGLACTPLGLLPTGTVATTFSSRTIDRSPDRSLLTHTRYADGPLAAAIPANSEQQTATMAGFVAPDRMATPLWIVNADVEIPGCISANFSRDRDQL